MSKKNHLPHRSLIAVTQEGDQARILLVDASAPGSAEIVKDERVATVSVVDRVAELRDELDRVGARPEAWIDMSGHHVYTTTVAVPSGLHAASSEVQVSGALSAASLDPASAPDTTDRKSVV